MSIGATEHHGDDPRTDHYEQSQHFDDEFDDYEAHDDDGVSEHDHLPDHHGSLNNDEQQQDTEGYSEFDHRRDERYDSIGDDDPEASAEWSENGGEELDDYSKADESVNICADGSIGWNTTLAPKIFVNCDVQHAYMVATDPAGSSEESSSCSASTKKRTRRKKKGKTGDDSRAQDSAPVPTWQPVSDASSFDDQQGQHISSGGLACQQGLSDERGVSSDDEGPPDLIPLETLFEDSEDCSGAALQCDLDLREPQVPAVSCQQGLGHQQGLAQQQGLADREDLAGAHYTMLSRTLLSARARAFEPDATEVRAPSMQAPRPPDQQGLYDSEQHGQQRDAKIRPTSTLPRSLDALMAGIAHAPKPPTSCQDLDTFQVKRQVHQLRERLQEQDLQLLELKRDHARELKDKDTQIVRLQGLLVCGSSRQESGRSSEAAGVSGYGRAAQDGEVAEASSRGSAPMTPERTQNSISDYFKTKLGVSPPPKNSVDRSSYGAHNSGRRGKANDWRAESEFDVNKAGCNRKVCKNLRPSALFSCPYDGTTRTQAFRGCLLCERCICDIRYYRNVFTESQILDSKLTEVEETVSEKPPVKLVAVLQKSAETHIDAGTA